MAKRLKLTSFELIRIKLRSEPNLGPGGCRLWLGYTNNRGYGEISLQDQTWPVHRAVYEHYVGRLNKGCEGYPAQAVRHTCGQKLCINPDHLRKQMETRQVRLERRRARDKHYQVNYNRQRNPQ